MPASAATPAPSIAELRTRIDALDAQLADLLERRALLAADVQRLKPVGGFADRDPERERRLVEAMAARAPRLGPDRIARIMAGVIEAGLEASEEERVQEEDESP
ncbi:chorismate mutase [Spinactinospora alkalitolerans]|uniref:Chorismate mutase n=1 Tax=Spinactinospora alkalitolerans TaxID=687207 RepID=A0A852TVR0_9ACTN|nr:chorismate mutase [Spinactinospora alkalitolerans]NYE48576.1 chorismate mutase [Spinactinospora alkalitolerans]